MCGTKSIHALQNMGAAGANRKDPHLGMDMMKIITPSYPAINAVHNVFSCTLEIINEELNRGHEIVKAVMKGTATYDKLWEPTEYFIQYKNYIEIIAEAGSAVRV